MISTAKLRHSLIKKLDERLLRLPYSVRVKLGRLTPEETADYHRQLIERKERKELQREMTKRANEYQRIIINSVARAGAVYKWTEQGARMARKIRFAERRISLDGFAIYFRVDTLRLPDKVLISFLRHEDVIETLCASCQRQVEVRWNPNEPDKGFWYVVQLKQGHRGIPREVDYAKMLNLLQAKKDATSLTIPIGCGENGKPLFRQLSDFPHALVAGATNQGKSVWVKQMLVTLLLRNDPQQLKLILVDLKGGVELSQFRDIPHLLIPIVKHKANVVESLRRVLAEVDHRLQVFESVGAVNIAEYKQRKHHSGRRMEHFAYWVLVIDELANVMLDPEIKGDPATLLADIAARARATGIYVIAATQHPSVDIISGLIKANFPVRIAFSTSSQSASRVIIDSGEAYGLSPAGRMIFFMGKDKLELQGPYIGPQMVEDKIKGIVSGRREETLERSRRHNFTPIDYFRHALLRYEGEFNYKVIFEDFRAHGVLRQEIYNVATDFEGQQVEVDGELFILQKQPDKGVLKQPRKLIPVVVEDDEPTETENPSQPLDQETFMALTGSQETGETTTPSLAPNPEELATDQRAKVSTASDLYETDPETDTEKEFAE